MESGMFFQTDPSQKRRYVIPPIAWSSSKAERNVLPVLNNLLENREMQLEDGRFLVAPGRFDRLVKEGKDTKQLNLLRVHEHFRAPWHLQKNAWSKVMLFRLLWDHVS